MNKSRYHVTILEKKSQSIIPLKCLFKGAGGKNTGSRVMEKLNIFKKCNLCEKSGENISLLSANHKQQGWIMVCRECWVHLYSENRMFSDSGALSKGPNSPCNSCTGCNFH